MKEALQESFYVSPEKSGSKYFIPGFDVGKEVEGLVKHKNSREVETNIRSYIREYAKQGLVLPNLIDLKDGKLVNSSSGLPITPGILALERNGSVLEASLKLEDFMAKALPGSMAVITSPMGPSGMKDQSGKYIDYPMTQTLIYWKEENDHLKGVTLVSDLNKEQNRELLYRLGGLNKNVYSTEITEMDDLASIVRNPVLLGPNSGYFLDRVVNEILNIRGNSDIRLDLPNGQVEYRSALEYKRDLRRIDELLVFNQEAEQLLDKFRDFMLSNLSCLDNPFTKRRLEDELYKTILKITGTLEEYKRSRNKPVSSGVERFGMTEKWIQDDSYGYGNEMAFLQNKVGCNGSGVGSQNISILGGRSYGGGGVSENLSGKCSKCGINHAEIGGCGFCNSCAMAA